MPHQLLNVIDVGFPFDEALEEPDPQAASRAAAGTDAAVAAKNCRRVIRLCVGDISIPPKARPSRALVMIAIQA
ncbi:MAG TPA: hypothetical protein VKV02_03680 [Acidobacteriaceae bacterium]|nr:hypothetical protein [Acidobacteriaceae bacterium]